MYSRIDPNALIGRPDVSLRGELWMWKSAQVFTERAHRIDSEKYQEMPFHTDFGGFVGQHILYNLN